MTRWRVDLRILQWIDNIKSSYWFWPSTAAISSILLSAFTLYLDDAFSFEWSQWIPQLYQARPEGARAFLSTVAGSIITVTGVILSLTILTVSTASTTYSPRLLPNFMKNKSIQLALATFTATFIYCLMILRNVFSERMGSDGAVASEAFVPQLSLFIAFLLTMLCVMVLIGFFHQVPQSIRLTNIVYDIGERLARKIDLSFARKGEVSRPPSFDSNEDLNLYRLSKEKSLQVCSTKAGYLQTLDVDKLIGIASKEELRIQLTVRPGDFIVVDQTLCLLDRPRSEPSAVMERIYDSFVIGAYRTETQDFMFLVDQLIEVAVKALSPGVNDPHTATAAISWIKNAVVKLDQKQFPTQLCCAANGELRLITEDSGLVRIVSEIFDKLNPYVAQDTIASKYLLDTYISLYDCTGADTKFIIRSKAAELLEIIKGVSFPTHNRMALEHLFNAHMGRG